ncbi:hypothetical protein DCC81_02180 [Chitinophaga parva]|uniref:Outer membrane protein beta-barrel domain-containing protein n=1 Tax=Chitinophaga parva TaxID=2169414 RepID=A0A2T7BKW3_9BACT|nr:porin family protein [Chitinophaga parva]PUZ28315.1 hypothetical protein DCC81_02180 [Chitinophaga parva]
MKKLLLLAVIMMTAAVSFGQVTFGVEAGPNFSSYTAKPDRGDKQTSKIRTSVRAGLTADLPLGNDCYIGTGLFYMGKGGVSKDDSNFKTKLSYLQLPIDFMYKADVGEGKVILAAGPYLALGLGGTAEYSLAGRTISTKIFEDEAGDAKLKRFDMGVGIQVGYQFPMNLYLGLNTDLGLVNAYSNSDVGKWHNTSFAVSVGYKFGGK